MNKTIIININGIVFHIEEEAYEVLRSYMIDVKRHFGHTADSHEIVGDIENRIAEMFSERIVSGSKEVIVMGDVEEVISQMGQVDDFAGETADTESSYYTSDDIPPLGNQRKLMRDPDDRVFGGVCSGLGHYFGMEAKWIRLILVLLFIFGGTGLLLYIVLWVVMPLARTRADRLAMRGEAATIQNFKRSFEEEVEGLRSNFSGAGQRLRNGAGSAGNAIGKLLVILAKVIGVLIIIGLCIGLITLMVAVVASFGLLGTDMGMKMFPLNVIDPEYRTALLIASLGLAVIPMLALVALIIRILFNRALIGRYTGFTLIALWLVAAGLTTMYATRTARDFREQSTIVEEVKLNPLPVFHLYKNDVNIIRLQRDNADRALTIQQRAAKRNVVFLGDQNRAYIRFARIDSLEAPYVSMAFTARGESYELAAQRAGQIEYTLRQDSSSIVFDSHFSLGGNELMRDQSLRMVVHIPIGTTVVIDESLYWHIRDLPIRQCGKNHEHHLNGQPNRTEWVMTATGLSCRYGPAPEEEDDKHEVSASDGEMIEPTVGDTVGVTEATGNITT